MGDENDQLVSAELAEIMLEDRIDIADAEQLARTVIALHGEVARLQKLLDENVEDRVRAHEILGGAEYESTSDAAERVVQGEVSASAEAGRLQSIVAGCTTPPTDAEIETHAAQGGGWVYRCTTKGGRELVSIAGPGWQTNAALSRRCGLWWLPIDASGKPCAWPAARGGE